MINPNKNKYYLTKQETEVAKKIAKNNIILKIGKNKLKYIYNKELLKLQIEYDPKIPIYYNLDLYYGL
jgi:hypothetical protein